MTLKGTPTRVGLSALKCNLHGRQWLQTQAPSVGNLRNTEQWKEERREERNRRVMADVGSRDAVESTKGHGLETGSCSLLRGEARHTSLHGSGDGP